MQETALEFSGGGPPGFRLDHLEVLNWGTFGSQVWRLEGGGQNMLITGEIGSGKSTLVDAITTLLLPANRITYNLAAGAGFRERDARSYVLGYYKRERPGEGGSARAVALRDESSYSVLLADFHNAAFDQRVVLAQVFYIKPGERQPQRFYVVGFRSLSIAEHFGEFGNDPRALKRRLKGMAHVEVFDSYPDYATCFRRRLMLKSDQALNLLYQTVSMKSVGNLTQFVREHMLEPAPVDERIAQMISNFDNLNRAHEQVVKAREQIGVLGPLVEQAARHGDESQTLAKREAERDAVSAYIAAGKRRLLTDKITAGESERARAADRASRIQAQLSRLATEEDQLKKALWEAGGSRLEEIRHAIDALQSRRDRARQSRETYIRQCRALELQPARDAEAFLATREQTAAMRNALHGEQQQLNEKRVDLGVALRRQQQAWDEVDAELKALERQPSNLPRRNLEIRTELAAAVDLEPDVLPFVGELIQVRDEAASWEGAIERLLHGFALSLLVADSHYAAVSAAVDRTRLKGKLVYYRVRDEQVPAPALAGAGSVVRKLEVKSDSAFADYLHATLMARFDYRCTADLTEFRRASRAITPAGQIKGSGYRHEKDDRYAIDDRRQYVLGWSNQRKIAALRAERQGLEADGLALAEQCKSLDQEIRALEQRRSAAEGLLHFEHFDVIDVDTPTREISRLEAEEREIRDSSDRVATLQQQLSEKQRQVAAAREQVSDKERRVAAIEAELAQHRERLAECEELAQDLDPQLTARLERCWAEHLGDQPLSLRSADRQGGELRVALQGRIDAGRKRIERLAEQMVGAMAHYRDRWPRDAEELDASLEAIGEYRRIHQRLVADDLPRHEARFAQLLREQTVHDVVLLQNALDRGEQDIVQAIDQINASLREVSYDQTANTYIHLLAERSTDAEVRQFRQDLRACSAGAIGDDDDDAYSEARFIQVKALVDRFRGREGLSAQDERWRAKVCDVRQWFEFSVSERYREDDSEREHYSDSSGKSGGQKEKLAYTILAAALAYQFGLEWSDKPSRSFRFVMIDEAFGRGSDESARYGLELFSRLNLQLLIVTPLQKIHVIEDYVSSVGFVHNEGGRNSVLRQLTLEAYKEERKARVLSSGQ